MQGTVSTGASTWADAVADTRLLMRGGAIAAPAVGASMPVKDSSEVNDADDDVCCGFCCRWLLLVGGVVCIANWTLKWTLKWTLSEP